jgi:peptidoglycan/xylan/chitin deacetylase (PgdA/CDA1 family)
MSRYQKLRNVFLVVFSLLVMSGFYITIPTIILPAIAILFVTIISLGAFFLAFGLFTPATLSGKRTEPLISITFDDGPISGKTDRILDILSEHQVSASFFCIGSRVIDHPEILERIEKEGHLIGNHSFSHRPMFDFFSTKRVIRELNDTDEAIAEILSAKPVYFRPPFGVTNPMIGNAVKYGKYRVIGWSLRSFDTIIKDPSKLYKRLTRSLKAGDIVLLHDYCESTIAVLPDFLRFIEKSGLKIVRLDTLLNEKPYR